MYFDLLSEVVPHGLRLVARDKRRIGFLYAFAAGPINRYLAHITSN